MALHHYNLTAATIARIKKPKTTPRLHRASPTNLGLSNTPIKISNNSWAKAESGISRESNMARGRIIGANRATIGNYEFKVGAPTFFLRART